MTGLAESEVEAAALEWLEGLGWTVAHGPAIAPDTAARERTDYGAVVLERRLREARWPGSTPSFPQRRSTTPSAD